MLRKQIVPFIEPAIHTIRAQRVMLDLDLAAIYGTSTMRLNVREYGGAYRVRSRSSLKQIGGRQLSTGNH
jgi:hypothetical protein